MVQGGMRGKVSTSAEFGHDDRPRKTEPRADLARGFSSSTSRAEWRPSISWTGCTLPRRAMPAHPLTTSCSAQTSRTQQRATSAVRRPLPYLSICTAPSDYLPDFVNHQYDPEAIKKLTVQKLFADRWSKLDPKANVTVVPSIEETINQTRDLAKSLQEGETVQAFITGSLHLVGGALGILEGADAL